MKQNSVSTHTDVAYLPTSGLETDIPCFSYKRLDDNSYVGSSTQLENGAVKRFLQALEIQDTVARLPPFVRSFPANMKPDAIQYLQKMQALDLTPVSLQNLLLRAYVEYVHPSMPLMDLHNFLNTVHYRHGRNGQVSLLLYQSVMFAATPFVDVKALRQAGYRTRKDAREKFFQKARLLYDFDYEHDGLVLVQSLLLMTYWDESPGDLKGAWYWMHIVVSSCYRIGLHRQSRGGIADTPILEQRLRRRVWWCCFIRDNVIALGRRQPPMIDDECFDVPMLMESDFEIEDLAQSSTVAHLDLTVLQDLKMQKQLAMACIETARLCIPVGQMLKARQSVQSTNQPGNGRDIDMLRSELQTWAASLPAGFQEYQSLVPDAQSGSSTMIMQQTMLHMLYQTAMWVLHHAEYSLSSGLRGLRSNSTWHASSSWKIARGAASQIFQMITNLDRLQLDGVLTGASIPLLTPAIILHLVEMESDVTPARELGQCMLVIEQLRDVYLIADRVASFIDAILTRPANDMDLSCDHHIISILKDELAAAIVAQEAESKNLQSIQNVPVDNVAFSTEELFNTSPLLEESPFTQQIMTPSDNPNGSIKGDITDLDCIDGYVDLDWKRVRESHIDGDFWLVENGAN